MDEESDEELEDGDEVVEPRVQSSSSSEDEDDAEETEVEFRATRAGDSSNFLNLHSCNVKTQICVTRPQCVKQQYAVITV
jgi:hypothetical protein